jgi:hypothetical protein
MKKRFATALVVAALTGLLWPGPASAEVITFTCDPVAEPSPAGWFGGPWSAPLRLVVDSSARTIEIFDQDNKAVAVTARPARLSSLNNYQLDIVITDSVINWGVIEMWGFSGYIDRKSGRLDMIWSNSSGYSPDTSSRQFHGTCRQR